MKFKCFDEAWHFTFNFIPDTTSGARQFECEDGSRISGIWICDNYEDCADGSDELYCGTSQGK